MFNKKLKTSLSNEEKHFKRQRHLYGSSWWGQYTPAGRERLRRKQKIISSFLAQGGKKRVLELGCGSEPIFLPKEKNDFYVACDLTLELLCLVKKSVEIETLVQANVEYLPFSAESFDVIIGSGILHHVNLGTALLEIKRVLKEAGEIVFFEPNMLNPQIFLERKIGFIRKIHQTETETAFHRWQLMKSLDKEWKDVKVEPIDFLHPIVPKKLINSINKIGLILERIPIVREFAGSLLIYAKKSNN